MSNLNQKFQDSVDAFDGIIEVLQTALDYAVEERKKLINLVEKELAPDVSHKVLTTEERTKVL